MNLLQHTISKELRDEFIIPRKFDYWWSVSFLFSIFFYGDTDNAIPADLAGHNPANLTAIQKMLSYLNEYVVKYQNDSPQELRSHISWQIQREIVLAF